MLMRRFLLPLTLSAILVFGSSQLSPGREQPAQSAVPVVSRAEFAQYVDQWSEPEGYFDTDNFITNETSYLHVIPELQKRTAPGGVYIGVGPDQNFSYIARLRPSEAFIVDIRRDNLLLHLLFKAIFASSRKPCASCRHYSGNA